MVAAAPGSSKRVTALEAWVEVPQVSSTVINYDGGLSSLHVNLGIVIQNASLRQRATAQGPRVRNAVGDAVRDYVEFYHIPGGPPDAETLLVMTQRAVDDVLGKPGEARVFLTGILVQRS